MLYQNKSFIHLKVNLIQKKDYLKQAIFLFME
jgi:hypothetical protein